MAKWRKNKLEYHFEPWYRDLSPRRRTKPTQVITLLTQNLTGGSRPASTFSWWKQTDEGYYIRQKNARMPEYLAATRENYYVVEATSVHRLKFVCPKSRSGPDVDGDSISIYVNPANGQASWACRRCTYFNAKERGGDGRPMWHEISAEFRDELARGGIIPEKNVLIEADELYRAICKNPGSSLYELDRIMNWSRGRSERIINKYLKNRVRLAQSRGKQKGYKIYPIN